MALWFALAGCGDVLGIAENPQLVAAGPWSCLAAPPMPAAPQKDSASVEVDACNFVSTNCSDPVTGLSASLCNKRDVNCSTPVTSGIVDANGKLRFSVPTGGSSGEGFDGYLQVNSANALCTNDAIFGASGRTLCALLPNCNPMAPDANCNVPVVARSLLFFNPPIRADLSQPLTLPLLPTAALQSSLQAAGQSKLDPTTGFLFITALDCEGKPAPGVQFAVDKPGVTQLYIQNGVISAIATETDASGLAGFFNVPPGFVNITGFVGSPDAGKSIGQIGVQITQFAITYGTVLPVVP